MEPFFLFLFSHILIPIPYAFFITSNEISLPFVSYATSNSTNVYKSYQMSFENFYYSSNGNECKIFHSLALGYFREFYLEVCLIFIDPQGSKNFVIENGIIIGVKEDVFIWQNGYGDWILKKLKATPDFVGQARSNLFIPFVFV